MWLNWSTFSTILYLSHYKKNKKFLFPTEDEVILTSYEEETYEEINTESESQTRIIKPERFEDAKIAAKFMMDGFLNVVVDLSYIVTEENGKRVAERIIDFLFGVSLKNKFSVLNRLNFGTYEYISRIGTSINRVMSLVK